MWPFSDKGLDAAQERDFGPRPEAVFVLLGGSRCRAGDEQRSGDRCDCERDGPAIEAHEWEMRSTGFHRIPP